MKVHQNFGAAQLEVKQFFKNFDSEVSCIIVFVKLHANILFLINLSRNLVNF